jgi:3-oxoacyl-[acyl-carrier-protein] synthase-3
VNNNNAFISAVQYYLPEAVEHNADLQIEYKGKADLDLLAKIGITSRHIAPKGARASDLAMIVAEQLFASVNIDRKDIDALVYCSGHRDYLVPATSCLLQDQLGLSKQIGTFDLVHACSGYMYGMAVTKGLMHGLGMNNVLLLTAALPSKYIYPKNLAVRLVFGDASSATLISRTTGENSTGNIGEFVFGTDGSGYEKIIVRDGWEASELDEASLNENRDEFGNVYTDSSLYIDGQSNLLFIMKQVPKLIEDTLAKNNLQIADIDLFIMHQANFFALEQVRRKLKIDEARFFYSMEHSGNTVQATIPIALKDAMTQGKIQPGSKVLIAGFGAGMNMAGTVLTF